MELKDRVAVVTGGNKGIGKAIALKLAEQGCHLALVARDRKSLEATAEQVKTFGVKAFIFQGDLTKDEVIKQFVQQVKQNFGRLDILVNNAGVGYFGPLAEFKVEQWDAMFNLNIRAVFLLTQQFLPLLRKAGEASVVNIASLAGKNSFAGGSGYVASKHALLGFSRCLMLEERKNGINVLAVCPGSVRTEFFNNLPDGQNALVKNILEPEDVARMVVEALKLPARAMVSELDIRPANP